MGKKLNQAEIEFVQQCLKDDAVTAVTVDGGLRGLIHVHTEKGTGNAFRSTLRPYTAPGAIAAAFEACAAATGSRDESTQPIDMTLFSRDVAADEVDEDPEQNPAAPNAYPTSTPNEGEARGSLAGPIEQDTRPAKPNKPNRR
jgi:hypothetical protein